MVPDKCGVFFVVVLFVFTIALVPNNKLGIVQFKDYIIRFSLFKNFVCICCEPIVCEKSRDISRHPIFAYIYVCDIIECDHGHILTDYNDCLYKLISTRRQYLLCRSCLTTIYQQYIGTFLEVLQCIKYKLIYSLI